MNRTASQGNCLESTPVENNILPTFSPFTSHVDEHCLPLSPAVPSNPPAPPLARATSADHPISSTHNGAVAMPREGPRPGDVEQNFPAPEIPMEPPERPNEVATSGRVEEVGRSNQDSHNGRVASTPLPDGYSESSDPFCLFSGT